MPPRRIGITGHRALQHPGLVLQRLRALFADEARESTVVIVSPLAEGSDRLAAAAGLDAGAALEVVLPFPRESYAEDFLDAGSREAFDRLLSRASRVTVVRPRAPPPGPLRDAAYLACGLAVVEQIDLLAAVWDGRPARGVGGTAQVVAYALALRKPVAWIDTRPPCALTRLPAP